MRQIAERESAFECRQTEGQRHCFELVACDRRRIAMSSSFSTSERLRRVLAACRAAVHIAPIAEEIGDD